MNTLLKKNNVASNHSMSYTKAKLFVQPKLTINKPSDIYEQEADAMADRVMLMSANETSHQPKPMTGLIGKSVQRKCSGCEEEEKKKNIMRKAEIGNPGMQVSSSFASSLNASKGGGSPLPQGTRDFMGNAFSTDFSQVRIHSGGNATQMSKGINAKAFTYRNDIFFNEGEYNPTSALGKKLLAHELTHVIQQQKDGVTQLQRQQVTATFRNCDLRTSGINDSHQVLDHALQIAQKAVIQAIATLGAAPVNGSIYETALNRHFIAPNANDRARISQKFRRMLRELLRRNNFVCDPNCNDQAKWDPANDLIHLCRRFFGLRNDPWCQAIVLIHEASHDVGVDGAGTHGANRGTSRYPLGAVPLPQNSNQTTRRRRNNADAYAFFAAHIMQGFDIDRNCF